MSKFNGFKVAALAASIALAMGSTAVMAATAPPAATQLPGVGSVVGGSGTLGTVSVPTAGGVQTIEISGNVVIDWGKAGGTINKTLPAGFNIGSDASLTFTGLTATDAVLNIDSTGNPSQIMGVLAGTGTDTNVYVANSNGIIVGSKAAISSTGEVGLIANTRGTGAFDGTASDTSIEYQGSGGTVDVATGATINGATVLVSGGNVNIDLSAITGGDLTVQAGVRNSGSTLVNDDASAVLTATGDFAGTSVANFASAGDASNSGTLSLTTARVDGTFTNTGDLTLGTGFAIDGGLVNNAGTVTQADAVTMGSLVNNGAYDASGYDLETTDGGITNNAKIEDVGAAIVAGDFANNGEFDADSLAVNGGSIANKGIVSLLNTTAVAAGDFINDGEFTTLGVSVTNGSIVNNSKLNVGTALPLPIDGFLLVKSDSTAGTGFTKGADYSITNAGKVTSLAGLWMRANSDSVGGDRVGGTKNDSTGSISNTGTLQVGAAGDLNLNAYNDVTLGGTVNVLKGTKYLASSANNKLGNVIVQAGDYAGGTLNTDGVATVATDLVSGGLGQVYGAKVKLMSNLTAGTFLNVVAGASARTDDATSDYAVRVAAGKTVSADNITVNGDQAGDAPNVIVQGTLEGNNINFGGLNAVSDVFTGPKGSISLFDPGQALAFNFTGAVKTVPYNNTPTNFRYNGLNVVSDGADTVNLWLNPTVYTTSGTADGSAVNILVNGSVMLSSSPVATVHGGDTSVIGVTNIPNTHLVLQSSGSIEVGDGGAFYWPGYVYLGNVKADADGNALPGTLGLGTITTDGEFNNVMPGDMAGASGIHFITQFPMTIGGDVVTNANAWVNFGTDLLTEGYATGAIDTGAFGFFGGVNTVGSVVQYGPLDEANFHTHAPTDAK